MSESTPTTVAASPGTGDRRLQRLSGLSLRARILAGFVGVLALAALASVVVVRYLVVADLDRRIDDQLVQETQELRRVEASVDPATGQPFGTRVKRVFDVYLQRNIASRNEAILTFVDGRLYRRTALVAATRIDSDPELVRRWATTRVVDRGRVMSPAGEVDYIALPLIAGSELRGVFVVASFRGREQEVVRAVTLATGGVGLAILLIGSLLGWRLADRILRPVQVVTRTARSIGETDLTRRIPVTGSDEIAQLASTFNAMLDRLESAFAAQRSFLDDAGHELRTPITIVRGHLELLGDDPAERRETLDLVADELERMSRLVDDLLTLAKAERFDFLVRSPIDVGALTDELFAKASALGDRRWVAERAAAGIVTADRQRLTQAALQLAQNAVDHTRSGQEIALGSSLADGELRIWLRDTGPGVPASERAQIFERFGRGSRGTRADGAGLGLSIVSAIARAHGGRVELTPAAGGGSVFTLVVPAGPPGDPQ